MIMRLCKHIVDAVNQASGNKLCENLAFCAFNVQFEYAYSVVQALNKLAQIDNIYLAVLFGKDV